MLNALEAAHRVAGCFEEDHLPYAIGGALALGVWSTPRQTKDVDISVFVPRSELPRVFDALERAGVMLDRTDATRSVGRIGFFKGRLGLVAIDVFISEHPQYEAMHRRRQARVEGASTLYFISAEDLALHKIVFGRSKDVTDLEHMFARRKIDIDYIRGWLTKMLPAGDRRFAILDDLERRFAT